MPSDKSSCLSRPDDIQLPMLNNINYIYIPCIESIAHKLLKQLQNVFLILEAVSKPDCRYFNGREFAFV
jgi:hypothetical protein